MSLVALSPLNPPASTGCLLLVRRDDEWYEELAIQFLIYDDT